MNREDTVSLIGSLLTAKKDLYELPEFLRDFRQEAGFDLPLFGYKTIEDFLGSLPETVQLVTLDQKTYVKSMNNTNTSLTESVEAEESAEKQNKSSKSGHNVGTGHHAESHRECPSFIEHEAGEGTSKEDKPEKTTAKDIKETIDKSNLPNSLASSSNDSNIGKEEDLDKSMGECSSTVEPVPGSLQKINVLLDEAEIPKIDLASFAKIGIYIEVCVPEACHPNKFILQLRKSKIKLVSLMNRMQGFYKQLNDQCLPKDYEFKPNQLCAALYKTRPDFEEWHRGKILNYGSEFSSVLLIDYGLIAQLHNRNLRYLDRMFGELPMQAIHGNLANIKPRNSEHWPEESRRMFFDLVFEKDLLAGIVAFNNEVVWISVALTHTLEDEFHIGDTLVEEDLATFACDYLDEPNIPSANDEAIKWERFIRPEDIGKTRKLRSVIEEWVKPEDRNILVYTSCNDRLKEMFSAVGKKEEETSEEDSD